METLSPLKLRIREAFGLKKINVIYFMEGLYYVTETELKLKLTYYLLFYFIPCFIVQILLDKFNIQRKSKLNDSESNPF